MLVAQSWSGAAVRQSKSVSRGGIVAMAFAILSLLLTGALPLAASAQSSNSTWSAPSTVYIPETGHTLDQLFLDLWRNAGGVHAFGNPISKEITQSNGHVVQYLQYARFEYWPEGDANGNTVFAASIGQELRPIALQRSVAGFATAAKPKQDGAALETARATQAWLPVDGSKLKLDDGTTSYVQESKHSVQGDFNTFWQNSGGADYLGNPLSEQYALNGVTYQVFERGQLAFTKDKGVWLVPVGQVLADKYKIDQSPTDQGDVPTYSEDLFIAPETPVAAAATGGQNADPNAELWLDVNLSTQYMVVYRGDVSVLETYVSTGREGFETPTGTFFINSKVGTQTMEGVLGGEYYNVPDVPDVMYFTDVGHAIHGAYWHNNFGTPMSHGCINLPMDVADWLFGQASVGTRIEIHY